MAEQEPEQGVQGTEAQHPRVNGVSGARVDDSAQSPTESTTQDGTPDSEDAVARAKQEEAMSAVIDVARSESVDSGKPMPMPRTVSWEQKILEYGPVKRIVSAAAPGYLDSVPSPGQSRAWIPTLIRFGPLSGILCMVLAIASITASLGILAGSNHQPTSGWSAPPSTYLAIFTAIGNLSMS